ncbi:MAG: hypothetical protein HN368_06910, partial [Spirochaetales bacterium]|nr:hypothetical protein [Spirochaetales bacterium]
MKHVCIAIIIAFSLLVSGFAEETEIQVRYDVNWVRGEIDIDLIMTVSNSADPAAIRSAAYDTASNQIGRIFCEILYNVQLDSSRTLKDAVLNDPQALSELLNVGERGLPHLMHLNSELSNITASYNFSFYPDIQRIFTSHSKAYMGETNLGFSPTIDYSGLVIYVQGEYPVHGEEPGERNPSHFAPALLPRIYDADMRPVLESNMMEPESLNFWGPVGYSTDTNYLSSQERVGDVPLLTMAIAV